MNPSEPSTNMPSPTPQNEEIVDPSVPSGSHEIITIRRHPFGIIVLYFQVTIGLLVSFGLIFLLLPNLFSNADQSSNSGLTTVLVLIFILVSAVAALFMVIATFLYRQNRWVVTDDGINQVSRIGIFNTQSSGLSMANIEDVTSERKGIFASIFGFGTLKCETAGALPNFHFYYCPNPDMYAKIILDARQKFINENPARAERANDLLNVPKN